MSHAPTPQQLEARAAFVDWTVRALTIIAGAGSGKTSTLLDLAHEAAEMGLHGAYICYNASTAKEASRKFPPNVSCGTAHAFAMRASKTAKYPTGYWSHRMPGPRNGRGRQSAKVVAGILGINDPLFFPGTDQQPYSPQRLATIVLRTIKSFCKTDAEQVGPEHIPYSANLPDALRPVLAERILPIARDCWDKELFLHDGVSGDPARCLNAEFDHILKRFALRHDVLMVDGPGGTKVPADFVMLDEAQDANAAFAGIFKDQLTRHGKKLVLVGDRAQSINRWNGAQDIMGDFPWGATVALTRSFRFGPQVAAEANKWLDLLGAQLRIEGHPPVDSTVGDFTEDERPDVILCRTNAGAMTAVFEQAKVGRKVHLVGKGDEVKRLAEAAISLDEQNWTSHPDLNGFTSWQEVVSYCEQGELGSEDLETAVKLIDEFGAEQVLEEIRRLATPQAADVTICTAHVSKGLEWDAVQIGSDFREPRKNPATGVLALPNEDELMLNYVAVTRAKKRLALGSLAWINDRALIARARRPERTAAAPNPAPEPVAAVAAVTALPVAPAAAGEPLTAAVRQLRGVCEAYQEGGPLGDARLAAEVKRIVELFTGRSTGEVLAALAGRGEARSA